MAKKLKVLFANPPWYDSENNNWHGVRAGSRWSFIFDYPLQQENSLGGSTVCLSL